MLLQVIEFSRVSSIFDIFSAHFSVIRGLISRRLRKKRGLFESRRVEKKKCQQQRCKEYKGRQWVGKSRIGKSSKLFGEMTPAPHPCPLPIGEGETISALVAWSVLRPQLIKIRNMISCDGKRGESGEMAAQHRPVDAVIAARMTLFICVHPWLMQPRFWNWREGDNVVTVLNP